ncbi:unnamed protein product, partial [Brassica rapa]
WLCSTFDYKPDSVSLNLLFGPLLDARAVKAAKGFLNSRYVKPLCEDGLVDEGIKESKVEKGINLFNKLKALNVKPSDRTYAALKKMRNLKMSDSVAASLNEILEIA